MQGVAAAQNREGEAKIGRNAVFLQSVFLFISLIKKRKQPSVYLKKW